MKEIRVYGLDLNKFKFNHENEIESLSNDDFISMAEERGKVWSLVGFTQDFNYGGIGNIHIRMIEVEIQESEKEYDRKSDLIKAVIEQIEEDLNYGDLDALYELLRFMHNRTLLHYLPEEKWNEYHVCKLI